ncbi:hypothetical protein PHLGIDRAFT_21907 [Phlebiopsis gigantea 11061_1 CR5-6]|uniref:Uncharacterized protein n=1 Tax=Phlebiopsis gigantea (strain 11061_1 CR5-6) TaxID=745531 RepID=A0A0C3NZV3_PHLG1|nr:hypothetical protein PHLGIDRAFT_21907 [Phlebiopsis gigantea 11061_1 CR5-6]
MGNKVSVSQDEQDEAEYRALIQDVENARRRARAAQDLEAGHTTPHCAQRTSASRPRPPQALRPEIPPNIPHVDRAKSWVTIPSYDGDASVQSQLDPDGRDYASSHQDVVILPAPQYIPPPPVVICPPAIAAPAQPVVILPGVCERPSRSASPPSVRLPFERNRQTRSPSLVIVRSSFERRSRSRSSSTLSYVDQQSPSRSPRSISYSRRRHSSPPPLPTIVRAPPSQHTANSSPRRMSSRSRGRSRSPRIITVETARCHRRSPMRSSPPRPEIITCHRKSRSPRSGSPPTMRQCLRSQSTLPIILPGSRSSSPIIVWQPPARARSRSPVRIIRTCGRSRSPLTIVRSPSRILRRSPVAHIIRTPTPPPPGSSIHPTSSEGTLARSIGIFSERITELQGVVTQLTHAMEISLQRSATTHSQTVSILTAMEGRLNGIEKGHGSLHDNLSLAELVSPNMDLPGRFQSEGYDTKDFNIKELEAYSPKIVLATGLGHPFLQRNCPSGPKWSPPWKVFPLKAFRGSDFTYVKIKSDWDDEALLRQISKTYEDLRKFWRRWFSLRSVSSITMVLADHTIIFPQRIGPAKVSPSKNLRLRYLLSHPHTMRGKHEFMEVLTSRTDFGIEFVERFQLGRIAFAVIIPVMASAILAIIYSILTDDVSSAFTISSYMTGAYSVCLVLVGILNLVES